MRFFYTIPIFALLSGCGTFVPSLTSAGGDFLFVRDVHRSIRCELIETVHEARLQADAIAELEGVDFEFYKNWGVRYTLTLSVVEDTSLNPSLNILSPTTPANLLSPGDVVFTLNTGLKFTAKATRTEIDQAFNTVGYLEGEELCPKGIPNNRVVVFGNDLGIRSWLITRLQLVKDRLITSLTNKEAFSYEVKFEIGKRGNLDPKWAFIQRNVKDSGGLFNSGRATTHTILVTFGPVSADRQELAPEAAATHNALLTGTLIRER